ncbi:hypothetical protein EJF36_10595 [Bacillus sp. HMF5848]|uniref:hypothetical protein n=1 Tax=Bacillus sp. HMF5848 TaxID=2495421 RepID=UPI000F799FD7|nr:hypothetical protein [Bacillus sp. HMF5848]RSK27294.1 hypothetical protein EJF36_10595 [Bacillus sp. HMF5848]
MNRLQFFSEMRKGFTDSLIAIGAPFINDEIKKIDRALEVASGRNWYPLKQIDLTTLEYELRLVGKQPTILYKKDNSLQAIHGCCSECGNLLHISSAESCIRCFTCDRYYSFLTYDGNLPILDLNVQMNNEKWFIAL